MSRDNIRKAGWSESTTLQQERAKFDAYASELGEFVNERLDMFETILGLGFDARVFRQRWDTNRIHTF